MNGKRAVMGKGERRKGKELPAWPCLVGVSSVGKVGFEEGRSETPEMGRKG